MVLFSLLFPSGVFRVHRSGAYVARVWSNGTAVRALLAPTALLYSTSTRRPRKARSPEDGTVFHPGASFTAPEDPVGTLLAPVSGVCLIVPY